MSTPPPSAAANITGDSSLAATTLIATARATIGRARAALVMYGVFVILAIVAVCNVYLLNWTDARMGVMTVAGQLLEVPELPPSLARTVGVRVTQQAADSLARIWVSTYLRRPERERLVAAAESLSLMQAARYTLVNGYDSTYFADELKYLREFRREVVLSVPVPIAGLRIDVNSLGLMFGLGLGCVLWLLHHALHQESVVLASLQTLVPLQVCDAIRLDSVQKSYEGVSMRLMSSLGLVVPLSLAVYQLWSDVASRALGEDVSERLTTTVLLGEAVSLLFCAALAIRLLLRVWRTGEPDSRYMVAGAGAGSR